MAESKERKAKKPMPLGLMLFLDALLLAACLLSFAYFHHVNPVFNNAVTVQVNPTAPQSETYMKRAGERSADKPGFAKKWPDRFTEGGTPVITDQSYSSEDISVQISSQTADDSVYYIADIYVRYANNLRSAFGSVDENGKDQYQMGTPALAKGTEITDRVKAIVAVNGDFYAGRDNGLVFRNLTLYRDTPRADVGAYFCDGSFKTFTKAEFQLQTEIANGLFHTMAFEPALVRGGQAISGYNGSIAGPNPRSGFGYYEPGHYCFVVADGRQEGYSVGPTIDCFAQFFADLGVQEAYNLDGGASSQMYFMGKLVNKPTLPGGAVRRLTDIFYIGEVEE